MPSPTTLFSGTLSPVVVYQAKPGKCRACLLGTGRPTAALMSGGFPAISDDPQHPWASTDATFGLGVTFDAATPNFGFPVTPGFTFGHTTAPLSRFLVWLAARTSIRCDPSA
ncbi:hypothetical protein OJF2_79400 (plasmid) [Aquisphaera giovannonii]|uniref:Uncharacterized protein n=1 Tax=Aquisphaera giovannonii TaxID=406548 RepID=A0A5B9WH81_9BACT|nr:hypothetical protein [Aquisphaera giovannonii]QEH39325.1 hypothetical protein OJF2_79400 [Aquisphaera giovannonii]